MKKRFTIEDVAKLAGVGKVTVSYVLNGRAKATRISPETAERVLAAAKELEYRPSAVARSLVSKRADAVSVVFQQGDFFSADSSFINEALRGVCEACSEADINLILHTRSFASPLEEAHALMDGRTDGVLVLRDEGDPLMDLLLDRGFPAVLFFTRPTREGVDFVDADNEIGGQIATKELLRLGHQRIAFVHGSKGSVASKDRLAGYQTAMLEAGLTVHPQSTFEIDTPVRVNANFLNWIRETKPTALVVWSDDVAFSCMHVLKAAQFSLPGDLSIIGFDSSKECDLSIPPLTSMRQPIFEMGYSATRKLIAKIRSEEPIQAQSIYPLTLDVRGSTQTLESSSSMKRKP